MKKPLLVVILIIFGLGIHFWIRHPALSLSYFHNEDTAGIAYSADLVMRGGLPFIDTVEIKAPGSFFLLAQWWSIFGRSLENAQTLMFLWSFLAACGIAWGTWFLYGSVWAASISGFLYLYLAPFTDSIDINYGAWMITPYIFSATILWWICREYNISGPSNNEMRSDPATSFPVKKKKLALWLTLGLLISISAVMKRQGAAIFPLSLWIIYRFEYHRKPAFTLLLGGIVLGFSIFFFPYLKQGQLVDGLTNYFFSKSGWEYLASDLVKTTTSSVADTARLPRIWDGIVGITVHLPLTGLLSLFVVIYNALVHWDLSVKQKRVVLPKSSDRSLEKGNNGEFITTEQVRKKSYLLEILLIYTLLSFIGTSLGLRFFKGYYLQLLPAFIWLGVDPSVWRGSYLASKSLFQKRIGYHQASLKLLIILFIIGLPFAVHSSWQHLDKARQMRSHPLYLPSWQIKELSHAIQKESSPTDKIWVWGRWAWPSYFYTKRVSATRYFKNLGVLTTQLSNTWNPKRKSMPTRFNPQSPWREAISELKQNKPLWIICAKNESYRQFKAFNQLLSEYYVSVSFKELKVKTRPNKPLFTVYRLKSKD